MDRASETMSPSKLSLLCVVPVRAFGHSDRKLTKSCHLWGRGRFGREGAALPCLALQQHRDGLGPESLEAPSPT